MLKVDNVLWMRLVAALKDKPVEQKIPRAILRTIGEVLRGMKDYPRIAPKRWGENAIARRDLLRLLAHKHADALKTLERMTEIRGVLPVPNFSHRINWRKPVNDNGDSSMVAFTNTNADGRRQMASISKVIGGACEPLYKNYTQLQKVMIFLAGEYRPQWAAVAPKYKNILVVSGDPHYWEIAYRQNRWTSCMAKTPLPSGLLSKEVVESLPLENRHTDFWRAQDPKRVQIACLFAPRYERLLARAAVWTVDVDGDSVGYCDRQYALNDAAAAELVTRLYKEGRISYNRKYGSDCGDAYNVVNDKGIKADRQWLSRWKVLINFKEGDTISYMDTFKEFNGYLENGKSELQLNVDGDMATTDYHL